MGLLFGQQRRRPSCEVLPDRVVKAAPPDEVRVEVEKTRAARDLATSTGRFVVPRVLTAEPNTWSQERIHDCVDLRSYWSERPDVELARRAGEILGLLHEGLRLPADCGRPLGEFSHLSGAEPVCVHGDYQISNLLVLRDTRELAVVDWSTADWIDPLVTRAEPELDLVLFLMSLLPRTVLDRHKTRGRRQHAVAFMSGYRSERQDFVPTDLPAYGHAVKRRYLRHTRRLKGLVRYSGSLPYLRQYGALLHHLAEV